ASCGRDDHLATQAAVLMRRRTRNTILLALACAALGALALLQVQHERAAMSDPLTAIDIAAIRTVQVECRGCAVRRYERRADGWMQVSPAPAVAVPDEMVTRLLAIAHAPVRTRHASGALDPRRIGLDPPQALLHLDAETLRF